MNSKNIDTIEYIDCNDKEEACIIIRQCDDHVAICLSLKSQGDIESLMDKRTTLKLIDALRKASEPIN